MRKEKTMKNFLALAAALLSMTAMLASCSSHGGGSDGGGEIYGGGLGYTGGGSGATPAGGTVRAVYTSYDRAGGYLNVEGGQYRTCTLTGNSNGGTITLSDGIKDDLTGTYGSASAPSGGTALAAAASVELRIEGCWSVSFSGADRNYSYSVFVTDELLSIRCSGRDGMTALITAGAAVSAEHASDMTGGGIAPGSAEDIFNGTKWTNAGSGVLSDSYLFKFEDGTVYRFGDDDHPYAYPYGPYTVRRTGDGYKVCFGFYEAGGTPAGGSSGIWQLAYFSLTLGGPGATEGDCVIEVSLTYSGASPFGDYYGSFDYSRLYKLAR